MSQDIIDLEEIVRSWAMDFRLEDDEARLVDDIRSTDIDWKYFRIKHYPTEYYDQVTKSAPQNHTLFTGYFTNDTSDTQTFNLNSERRTTSVCTISMDRTYTIGYSVDIKRAPPNPVIEANAGFKGEMSVTNANQETLEEEIVWAVNNQIAVPPRSQTKADLVLLEEEYSSHFKCKTKFNGTVFVTLRNKRNNSVITKLRAHVRQIFRANQGFTIDNTGVYFVSMGHCKSRFGIEQHIKLTQIRTVDGETGEGIDPVIL